MTKIEPGDEVSVSTSYGLFRGQVQRIVDTDGDQEYVVIVPDKFVLQVGRKQIAEVSKK
jgi:hypothetical protein